MSATFVHVLPLALGAAISPTILTIGVLILSGQHGRLRMAIFTAVNIAAMGVIGIVVIRLVSHAVTKNSSSAVNGGSATVDVVLGIVLLLLAARAIFRDDVDKPEKPKDEDDSLHPVRYALLGLVFTVTNMTTLALFLPALKEISVAKLPGGEEILVASAVVLIATVTAWLPLLASIVVPGPADRVLASINHFTNVHRKSITVAVLIFFGLYLLIKGLTEG